MGTEVRTSPAFWKAPNAVISPRRTIVLPLEPSQPTLNHGSPTPMMAAMRAFAISANPLCRYNFIQKPLLARPIANGSLTTSWSKWHATVEESARIRIGCAEDWTGRRVRLLRFPGAQGSEGRRHYNRPGKPKYRHHSDLEVDGGQRLLSARHAFFCDKNHRKRTPRWHSALLRRPDRAELRHRIVRTGRTGTLWGHNSRDAHLRHYSDRRSPAVCRTPARPA